MISRLLLIFLITVSSFAHSQCLTDFQKLIPAPVGVTDNQYGHALAMHGDYMAVGAGWSDSLANRAGLIYLYKFTAGQWNFINILKPSLIKEYLYFGASIAMSEDYIVTTAGGSGGAVYVFKKPSSGWESSVSETAILKMGKNVIFINEANVVISENQNSIVVCEDFGNEGACYSFSKSSASAWIDRTSADQIIKNPDGYSPYFGGSLVTKDSTLIIGDHISTDGIGAIYVYQFIKNQNKYVQKAKLKTDINGLALGLRTTFTEDGIFSTLTERNQQNQNFKILFYPKPTNAIWVDSNQICAFSPKQTIVENANPFSLSSSDGNVFFAFGDKTTETGELIKISKGLTGWCAPDYQRISKNSFPLYYGYRIAASSKKVATTLASSTDQRANKIAVDAVFETITGWLNQRVVSLRGNTKDHLFGSAILLHHNSLFVGARHDNTLKERAGKVYVYEKSGSNWIKKDELFPELVSANAGNFGSSIAAYNDELAILGGSTASIHLYKKNGSSWVSPTQTQIIENPEPLELFFYGGNNGMAMNDRWLVLAAVDGTSSDKNALVIYQKESNQWVFHQKIVTNNIIPLTLASISVDIDSNLIAFGDTGYFKGGIVHLLELNNGNNKWEIKHELSPSTYGNSFGLNLAEFGSSVDIERDYIFVGSPGFDTNSISNLGAVFVYTKPAAGWKSNTESSLIYPKNKIPKTLFGYSVKSRGNLLMVGAPGSDPGELHVFQGLNYDWSQNIPLLTLQGDTFKYDNYGLTAALDDDFLFVGAPVENLLSGLRSGSVYATKMPPVIKLVRPVCSNGGRFTLFGYPFGGVWSGKGIVDINTGEFDPTIAGVGIHELTYKTPNCFYDGKLRIEVKPPAIVIPLNDQTVFICKSPPSKKQIGVQSIGNQSYRWFFRAKPTDSFMPKGVQSSVLSISDVGEYYVEVSTEFCSVNSSIVKVEYENIDIKTYPIPVVCDASLSSIDLLASPLGGSWSGNAVNVASGRVAANLLANGSYIYTYQIKSNSNCVFTSETMLIKDALPELRILTEIDLCGNENTKLLSEPDPAGNYQWFRFSEILKSYQQIYSGRDLSRIEIETGGKYYLRVDNSNCFSLSPEVEINKKSKDSVFVPNVITPNGDGKNDVLKVYGNIENYSLKIFNRYGSEIFSSFTKEGWDGSEVSSGVYFWIVSYLNCLGKETKIKGWVQVLRSD